MTDLTDPTEAPSASPAGASPWSHALWAGPLLAVVAFFSYYTYFVQFPSFRDTAWLNIAGLIAACGVSWLGLRRAWSGSVGAKLAGVASLLVAAFFTTVLVAYCYGLSYQLPAAENVAEAGEALPAVTLIAHDGRAVPLAETATEPLVLVVYRGHW